MCDGATVGAAGGGAGSGGAALSDSGSLPTPPLPAPPPAEKVAFRTRVKGVKLLPHERALMEQGELEDVTHEGATAVWLRAESTPATTYEAAEEAATAAGLGLSSGAGSGAEWAPASAAAGAQQTR